MAVEKVIMKTDTGYYFYDEPEEDFDYKAEGAIGVLLEDTEVGVHSCEKSELYEDMKGYVDKIQKEEELPDKERYLVCWFEYGGSFTLHQMVDYDISKSEIIANVINQKYREGAFYYLLKDMKEIA